MGLALSASTGNLRETGSNLEDRWVNVNEAANT